MKNLLCYQFFHITALKHTHTHTHTHTSAAALGSYYSKILKYILYTHTHTHTHTYIYIYTLNEYDFLI